MSDALTRLLGRFTPDAAGLDRDALMYQAGRSSVPSPARWKALAAMLALGQALTILLFLARPASSPEPPVRSRSEPEVAPRSVPPAPGWTMRRRLLDGAGDVRPSLHDSNLVPDEPPLRVYTSWTTFSVD